MSKHKNKRRYNFGRVFFPGTPNPIPTEVLFQPLGNHVGNVMRLIKNWNLDDFPGDTIQERQKSQQRVIEGAKIHDMGKPQKFEIRVELENQSKFRQYIYSFRGHRFLAESQNEWAQFLGQGHHDFSVADISRDTYTLKKQQHYAEILNKDPLAYARELYILEMCDQIEAELACRVIGDEKQAESRTFMDYTIASHPSEETVYFIEPWPFSQLSIKLIFESWSMQLTNDDKNQLKNCHKKQGDAELGKTLDSIAKTWWNSHTEEQSKQSPKAITLKPYPSSVNDAKTWDCQSCYQQLAGFEPNPMQAQMFKALTFNLNPAILLKGPTGSGKLEAILFPALAQHYRLFFPLPARSLLEDQKQRVEMYLKQFSALHPGRELSLVVDTGSEMYRWVYQDGEIVKRRINSRRHLYKGDVILTTLDKFLYRYFAFGDKQKSFIFPLRIQKEKTLICFDEAHSYDAVSFTNFCGLVKSLYESGRSLVLMTATMPTGHIDRFEYLHQIDYIDHLPNVNKLRQFQQQTLNQPYLNQKSFEWFREIKWDQEYREHFHNEFTKIIVREWQKNKRIIAVVETVKDAAAIYQLVQLNLGLNAHIQKQLLFLYHGRIAEQRRPEIYEQLKTCDRDNHPYILITTSAIEVGCDLNCDLLISQICPPENLIQRAGRCNRKGNVPNAKVIIVGDEIPDFARTLNEAEWQNYQKTLLELESFETQKISQCISKSLSVDDYRVVDLFSQLEEYVYHADLTCKPIHDKGLVITRSWTPSVTLIYEDGSQDPPRVTVPVDRLLLKKGENQYANTHVYERYYDQENTRWSFQDLRSGLTYFKDIVIKINPNRSGAEMFESYPEYPYDPQIGFVDLPGIFIKLKPKNFEQKLLYDIPGKHKAILSYMQPIDSNRINLETSYAL